MEPADPFVARYSKTIDKSVDFFKRNPPTTFAGCKLIINKTNPQATDREVVKFYEIVMAYGHHYQELISHYYSIGLFKDSKTLSDRIGATCISELCTLQSGNFDRIESLESPPRPDSELGEVTNWVKYHFMRRTLHRASKDFSHKTKDAKALVYLYQGNYVKALQFISGDLFVGNEHHLFKAFCHYGLGQLIEGTASYNRAIEKEAVLTNTFEPFLLLLGLSSALAPNQIDRLHKGLNLPSLELFYFATEEGAANAANRSYINVLAKEYPNPFIRFFCLITSAKKTQRVTASIFLGLVKNEPVQNIDYLTFLYLSKSNWQEALHYCRERDKIHPHPLLLENMIISVYSLVFSEPKNPQHILELEKLCEEYLSRGYDKENILSALARIARHKGDLESAKDLYIASMQYYCLDIDIINLAEIYMGLGDTKAACDFLIEQTKNFKFPELLLTTEKILIRLSTDEVLKEFYKTHREEHPDFSSKLKALEDKLLEDHKDLEANDVAELPIDKAIEILNLRIDRKKDAPASFYLSLLYYKKGLKEESVNTIKKFTSQYEIKSSEALFSILKTDTPFICFILPYLSKNNSFFDHLAMMAYFYNNEYAKVLEPSLALIKAFPDYTLAYYFRVKSFYQLGNIPGTLYMIEMIKEKGWMNDDIIKIKAELEQKKASNPPTPKEEPVRKEALRKQTQVQDPFKLEKKDISEAKQSHLEKRDTLKNKGETSASHIGSKSVKNSVDPIERKKRFNPLDYKPKEDEPVAPLPAATELKPQPKAAHAPLFATHLDHNQKSQVEYAIERFNDLIQLDKKEINPKFKDDLVFRNHIYNYVRGFGILSRLANPPLKDKLYKIRDDARHEFIVCSLEGCESLLNYLKQVNLVSQMEDWIKGGAITNLAVSPFSLRDSIKNRRFEHADAAEKDRIRVEFIKKELDLLIQFMDPIKTLNDLKMEGVYQNAMKASMMMLGKTWTKLNPTLKARLAPYFRSLNLEGNKGAHNLKPQIVHDQITFNLGFDDISIESLWEFAQNANLLKNFLVGII